MAGATKGDQASGAEDKKSSVVLEIERAEKAGMNMLLPGMGININGLAEFYNPVIDYVKLSSDAKDNDVYYHPESNLLVPAKPGLLKLARGAGIQWNPKETGRTDSRADRNYVSYRALGGVRTADGGVAWFPGEYDIDLEVIEEKLRSQYEKKGKDAKKTGNELQNYITYCVKRDILKKREHKLKTCETGAISRVIRALLIGLNPGYTKKELEQPFVVVRIVFKPDYSDPQVRRTMLSNGIASMTDIYGASEQDESLFSKPSSVISPAQDQLPSTNNKENPEDNNDDELTNEKADFLASDKPSKTDTLKKLAKRKGYDLKQLKKPLAQFEDNYLEDFFDKLISMEDKNDIPF